MKSERPNRKSIPVYITLQTLALVGCWIWFAGLWAVAFFNYDLGDVEWWLLVAAACAGLYGLRPNLERAIDTAWLQGLDNSKAVADRLAQLRPIKRRIDLIFSLIMVLVLGVLSLIWALGLLALKPA
jgi:hypothetical protein